MPDTPEHAFTEAGKTLAAELYKSDPWGPAAVAAVEKQAAQRAIDALTTATVAAINDHADIRLPDGRLAIARDHAVEVIRGVLEPHDA